MKKAMAISIFLMASAIGYAVPTVSNEMAKQRYPWGLVDITCTVSGIDGATAEYEVALEAVMPESGNTNKVSNFWVVQNGTNSTDRFVHTNGNYRLLWDARADLGEVHYSNMVLRVIVDHGRVRLWKGGPYWATTNIGAEKPEDYGYYFWWGDTVGYKRENDKWVASDGSSLNFSFSSGNTPIDSENLVSLQRKGWITEDYVLTSDHDAAHVQWGGRWRMPTLQELGGLGRCDWTWTTKNGVNGYEVRGRGDYASNSIFLPCGSYWSSVAGPDDFYFFPQGIYFDDLICTSDMNFRCYYGQSVRPVQGFTKSVVAMVGGSVGDTAPFLLDTTQPVVDSLPVSWDAAWIGGDANATVVIADNGTEAKRTTGAGDFTHTLSGIGRHDLTYTTYIGDVAHDEVYTATVFKDWKYEVVDGGAVITETTQASGEVTIPSEIDGYPVTDVASGAFENCSGLTTVYIPQGYTGRTDVFPSTTTVIHHRRIVTFDATGGTVSPATNIVEYGSSYGFLPEPSRAGYTFIGWKWNDQSILAETIVTALDNHTLFAQWSANKYSVVFDAGGGTGGTTVAQDYGTRLTAPTVTRANYRFVGWSPECPETMPARNLTCTARWQCNWSCTTNASGTLTINGVNFTPSGAVSVPSSIDGHPVRSIGYRAFYDCSGLTSVTIPDSVTSIGSRAFSSCTDLTAITIPATVRWLGDEAFAGCSSLVSVTYLGDAPDTGANIYLGTPRTLVSYVRGGSIGWSGGISSNIPTVWNDRAMACEWTVTFDAQGGMLEEMVRFVANEDVVGVLPSPTRDGHMFDGWFTKPAGGVRVTSATKVSGHVTYYAHWRANGTETDFVNYGGVVSDMAFAKAQTVRGALHDTRGGIVGTVELKFGKINARKGTVKISVTATLLADGKATKVAAKAVNVEVAARLAGTLALPFKDPIGEMVLEMAADGTFTLKNGNYVMVAASVGGNWTRAGARVWVDGGRGATALPEGTIEELLPNGEPVIPKAGKWSFAKAARVKYAKDKQTKALGLIIDTKKGTNRSAMKLTYTPKTGIFKGSFKIYAIQGGKLKKFTVKVIGVVVDGKGQGSAAGPGGVSFAVTVE